MKKTIAYFIISVFFTLPATAAFSKVLHVPYTLQSPYSDWRQPWEDACEEAATVIVDNYYRGFAGERLSKKSAHDEILNVIRIENNHFGFNKDTNAAQIAEIINNFFPWEAYIFENPTIENITGEIDANRPVIIPFHGKSANNPYFLNGGPDYHTAVIKGYDSKKQEFIVQDPGIGKGLDYRYSYDTLMNAMHDFMPGNKTKFGRKVAIFTKKEIQKSDEMDGDNDKLSKRKELEHGSILWLEDSDGDGYLDGSEVEKGFSPIIAESKMRENSLIRSQDNPKIFLLKNNRKHHIINERIFLSNGWKWKDIQIVSKAFMDLLVESEAIKN